MDDDEEAEEDLLKEVLFVLGFLLKISNDVDRKSGELMIDMLYMKITFGFYRSMMWYIVYNIYICI